MDKITRVRAALRGDPVDRVPASFWFHFPPEKAHGEATIQAHLTYYRESGVDFLKVMNEHHYQTETPLLTPADWQHLRPAPITAPFYQQQLEELRRITEALKGECLVVNTIFNAYAAGNHASDNQVTAHLKANPQAVHTGLSAIAESLAGFAVACIEAGAAGIYFAAQGGEADRFTMEEFLQYIKPHDLTVLNAVKDIGEFHLLHICRANVRLPLYIDYPAHAVNWAVTKNNLGLKQGYLLFRRTVVGGLDDRGILAYGPPGEIRRAVQTLIAGFGTQGLMVGADCTLPTDVPLENIRAAMEATAL